MKKILLLFTLSCSFNIQAQEISKKESFDSIISLIKKSHSNLDPNALYVIADFDNIAVTININSSNKSTVSQIVESFTLDLNTISDVFIVPPIDNQSKLIVNVREPVLITTETTEFKNLFHEELIQNDLKESSDIWFIFENESVANQLEKALIKFKKLLNGN